MPATVAGTTKGLAAAIGTGETFTDNSWRRRGDVSWSKACPGAIHRWWLNMVRHGWLESRFLRYESFEVEVELVVGQNRGRELMIHRRCHKAVVSCARGRTTKTPRLGA
jgi:hypothetical protein